MTLEQIQKQHDEHFGTGKFLFTDFQPGKIAKVKRKCLTCGTEIITKAHIDYSLGGLGCNICNLKANSDNLAILKDKDMEDIVLLYEAGWAHGEIAEKYDVCADAIGYHLRKRGLLYDYAGTDNFSGFKSDNTHANRSCYLYVVSMHGGEFQKIGIAINTLNRSNLYEEVLYERNSTRATTWVVEQHALNQTKFAVPTSLPQKLQDFDGSSEIRQGLDLQLLASELDKWMDEAEEIGWSDFFYTYLLNT